MLRKSKLIITILTFFLLLGSVRLAKATEINGTIPGFDCYRSAATLDQVLTQLQRDHPTLVSLSTIGYSYENRPIRMLKLSNQNSPEVKSRLVLISGLRANSFAPVELSLQFAESLLSTYGQDSTSTWLLDFGEVYAVFLANPDGRQRAEAQAQASEATTWQNNANPSYCTTAKPGVRLNRNFPFAWNAQNPDPCSPLYPGPSASSEPETQALISFLSGLVAEPQPTLLIHLDSYENWILTPYQYDSLAPNPYEDQLFTLANKIAYQTAALPIVGAGPDSIETHGTLLDYAFGTLRLPALTYKMGTLQSGGHTPACWYFREQLRDQTLFALKRAASTSLAPYQLAYGPETIVETKILGPGFISVEGFADDYSFYREAVTDYTSVDRLTWSLDFHPEHPNAVVHEVTDLPQIPGFPFRSTFRIKIDYRGIEPGRHQLFMIAWDRATATDPSRPGLITSFFVDIPLLQYLPLLLK